MKTRRRTNLTSLLNQCNICVLWRRVSDVSNETRTFWHSLLDESERGKADQFRFSDDRESYVAAHALLRQSLSSIMQANPRSWHFMTGINGKPEIMRQGDLPPLRVNLSHTQGMVVVALGLEYDIGVDVEPMFRVVEPNIWDKVLAPVEISQISRMPAQSQQNARMSLWTLKEALVKASGQGLSAQLGSIVCGINPPQLLKSGSLPGTIHDWQVWQHHLDGPFSIAVAVRVQGKNKRPNCRFLEASLR